ncbi:MAG: DUF177 domain-containing protein [Acidobacteria bacterium]|nr:DUF177 domain-containing protein [Acidobacteriota bacterium]
MFIEIRELGLHPIDFEEEFAPGAIDFGTELEQRSPIKTSGRAQLVEEHHGKSLSIKDIRLNGKLATTIAVPCARCLELVQLDVKRDFDLLYRPQGSDAGEEESAVPSAESEVSYYQGAGLQLEDALREQVLLEVPLKAICRDDCKGLCPHCGKNLNVEQCSCGTQPNDPRWTALQEIRSKLQGER